MNRKAIIISISGLELSKKEKNLIKKEKPWGVILFKRNIKSLDQIIRLVQSIRKTIKDKKYPILLDEEGGRVTRLSNLFDNSIYSQNYFGRLYEKNKSIGSSVFQNCTFFEITQVSQRVQADPKGPVPMFLMRGLMFLLRV